MSSKPVAPSTFENIKRQLSSDETFDVFEQVFPRVMPLENFQWCMQRLAADYGESAVDFTVELMKVYGVHCGSDVRPDRRRMFYATVMRQCELYERDYPSHNGECC